MELAAALAIGLGLVVAFDGLTGPRGGTQIVPGRERLLKFGAAVGGASAAFVLTGWPVAALAGAAAGLAVPKMLSEQRSLRRRIELTDALAEAAGALRDSVRGGLGLSDGLAGLAAWGPPLLREDMQILATEAGRMGVAEAATRFARRIGDPGADLLAATLAFNARVGGRQVAEVLDAMADELGAEARTVRELHARQARQRTSARLVALAPVALLLVLRQVNPGYLQAYDTGSGQAVLGLAGLLIAAGYAAMTRIARFSRPVRISLGDDE